MLGLPLVFAAPMVLIALAALPALYFLLRVTPPPPKRIPLPTIPLVKDLVTPERQPARMPWWLLLLRLALAGIAILALAGPLWNPPPVESGAGRGPLVLLIDNGWGAAPDWPKRRDRAITLIETAVDRPVVLRAASEEAAIPTAVNARAAIERLRGLQPVPHSIDRAKQFAALASYAEATPQAEILWLSDRMATGTDEAATRTFIEKLGPRLRIIADERTPVRAIASASNERDAMVVKLVRPASGGESLGIVRALDSKGRPLGEAPFDFAGTAKAEAK
ncbi:MAG: BatA domain-containing protein, partial [Proteobacteria bacterium]|nr:BatA domain-containing protein [Pseudomonadota bacterium]